MAEKTSDEALASAARDGDIAAFNELFARYKMPMLNFIYRMIGIRETAEEVTQEVFVSVYKNLAIFDPKKKFVTWIYTIARNLAKNSLRDKKYFRDVSLEAAISSEDGSPCLKDVIADPSLGPDMIAVDDELAREAQQAIDALPLKYREVITLCSVQGMTYKEAAGVLGCSAMTIMFRLNKAKEIFMKRLEIEPAESRKGSKDNE